MTERPDKKILQKDIELILAKYEISDCRHYDVLKDFMLSTILYHWEDPSVSDLIPLKEGIDEIRKSMQMFKKYRYDFKISIFGSARTPREHPLYKITSEFARLSALKGYKIITGAGPGIMEAGNLGAGAKNSFGLGLKLPYENENEIFKQMPEHLTIFNNFYSRKHTFYRESDAVVVLPGGFGTMDEIFQGLTTLQTGKTRITPFILLDEPKGVFWQAFDAWLIKHMEDDGYISIYDRSMFSICTSAEEALEKIDSFYKVYHSYIKMDDNEIFLQLKKKLTEEEEQVLERLALQFELNDMEFVRERYYPDNTLYVYRFSIKGLKEYAKIKLFIEALNQAIA